LGRCKKRLIEFEIAIDISNKVQTAEKSHSAQHHEKDITGEGSETEELDGLKNTIHV